MSSIHSIHSYFRGIFAPVLVIKLLQDQVFFNNKLLQM